MIARSDLRNIARARLRDAEMLLRARRYDGAVYLCGYSVEIALKARICRTSGWREFPETNRDFEGYQTHFPQVTPDISPPTRWPDVRRS